jgi:hypothetical protein
MVYLATADGKKEGEGFDLSIDLPPEYGLN